MTTPYENHSSAFQDGVLDHAWIRAVPRVRVAWFAPGGVALGFKVAEDVFCACSILFGERDEDSGHDGSPSFFTATTMISHTCRYTPLRFWPSCERSLLNRASWIVLMRAFSCSSV